MCEQITIDNSPPPRYGPPTRTDYRLVVENLSSRVSWQVRRFILIMASSNYLLNKFYS